MKKCMFILLVMCFFLTGCWDKRELNEIAIALAIGIDKVDDGYQVSAQVVIPSEVSAKGSTGGTPVVLYQETGETVYAALRKITKTAPRKVYAGHLQMLILGEDLAMEGVGESLDLLARDWEIRSDFFVAIAKDAKASEILNVTTILESIPATKMFKSLKTSEKSWAATTGVTLDDLIVNMISDGKEAVLTGIELKGNKEMGTSKQNMESITPSVEIRYDNLAVFKKDKLVGWLTMDESRAYAGITNTVKSTVTPISCPDGGKTTIEVYQFETDVKGNVKGGKPGVDIHIQVVGGVGDVECQIDLDKTKTIDELEKIYEKVGEEHVRQSVSSLQQNYNADIFGFGEAIHRSNPKEWKKLKKNWDEEFSNLTVNVNIKLRIIRIGTESNSFLKKLKEK